MEEDIKTRIMSFTHMHAVPHPSTASVVQGKNLPILTSSTSHFLVRTEENLSTHHYEYLLFSGCAHRQPAVGGPPPTDLGLFGALAAVAGSQLAFLHMGADSCVPYRRARAAGWLGTLRALSAYV